MPLSTTPGASNSTNTNTTPIVLSEEERERLHAEMLAEQESLDKFMSAKDDVETHDDDSLLEDLNGR